MANVLFTTGFCDQGFCEGRKPKSHGGKPVKTCPRILTHMTKSWSCKCKCHADLDKLFEMAGMERMLQENPEYAPERTGFVMPSLEDRTLAVVARDTSPAVVIKSPLPEHVPPTIVRAYGPTASGRAGRGQLELNVKQVCDEWVMEKPDDSCTPQWISEKIAYMEGIKAPSVGAIGAVFDRWSMLGFALIGRKPVRFVGYTDEGVKHGLEGLKLMARDKKAKVKR